MANPHVVELEAEKFLRKLIQDSIDEPTKLATKLNVILQHMRFSGKENSMPYQVISRAMETLIKQHGLAIEALMSSRLPLTAGAQEGESGASQVTGSSQRTGVTKDPKASSTESQPDSYASGLLRVGPTSTGLDMYQGSPSNMTGESQARPGSISNLQDGGEFMQLGSLHQQADAVTNAENIDVNSSCQNQVAASAPSSELQSVGGKLLPGTSHQQLIMELDVANRKRNIGSMKQSDIGSSDSGNRSTRKRMDREYGITLEVLHLYSGEKLHEVANLLGVSRSTLKRVCRQHNIHRWPPRKAKIDNISRFPQKIVQPTKEYVRDYCPKQLSLPDHSVEEDDNSEPHIMPDARRIQDDSNMIVKVTYKNEIIKFHLSLSSRKVDLEAEVAKRLPLSIGSFNLKYLDEDLEWIKVACDDDLRMCICGLRSLGRDKIRMLVNV